MAVHFVGFKGDEFNRAVQVFGEPDFVHRRWDVRAQQEVVEGDVAIFADGDENKEPAHPSFDDSCHF